MDSNLTAEKIAELKRWLVIAQQPYNPRYKAAKRDAQARVTRFVPELIVALEAAETEADSEAGHWIEIIRRLDPENLCDVFDGLGVEENLRQWLAARDARLKNEGAAEWLECHRNDDWLAVDQRERFEQEAAELRRKAGE